VEKLKEILLQHRITEFGVCAFPKKEQLIPCRAISRLPSEPKCVIMCAFPYYVGEPQPRNISRYAIVNDYHVVVKNILSSACEKLARCFGADFVPFVDNSPIPEVACAVQARIGFKGKNGLLINQKYGSYVFLGEIVTDFAFEPSSPLENPHCIGCNRCIRFCPTRALKTQPFDKDRCLSHITQKKGELSQEEQELIQKSGILWGCDKCQEVCPHNKEIPKTQLQDFLDDIVSFAEYERIEELVKTRAFGFRGADVVKRNYRIISGNQGKISP
ncbi:MAG: hypothetical protein K0R90_466, partial [Oscillospiraceae bacterium]|nr:hypothetical protein [Oscillospiraceae bacterium]